jgi:hypothetical protein
VQRYTGCLAPAEPRVANGTTLTVTLFVNGRSVADVPPGGSESSVSDTALPPLPWTVEARTSSGRVLATAFAGTGATGSGQSGRYDFDLTCGRLTIWTGETQPPAPAASGSPGTPGDCAP